MTPRRFEFARWRANFEANTQRLEALTPRAVAPGRWTASQCIEHLRLTAHGYLPSWREVKRAQPGGNYPFWWRWFLDGLANPKKLRTKTPATFDPVADSTLANVLPQYLQLRKEVLAFAVAMDQSQSGGVKIASPFAAWMKYPHDFSFDLWLAHEGRHLTQAENG